MTHPPAYPAQTYDRFRPRYPKELTAALFNLTNYRAPDTILEIGCGTGKATEGLIESGAVVHAVEPNVEMASIAAQKFSHRMHGSVPVFSWTPLKFEDFPIQEQAFSLITSAQAFHWVEQGIAFQKSHQLLRSGGALAIYRNNRKYDDEFTRLEHQVQVRLNGCDPHGFWNENYYQALAECVTNFISHAAGRFHRPQVYEFDHTVTYTTEEYIGLLNTFFDDSQNTPHWPRVLEETAKIIDGFGGSIEYHWTAILYLLFKR